jgi:hypothetical protein
MVTINYYKKGTFTVINSINKISLKCHMNLPINGKVTFDKILYLFSDWKYVLNFDMIRGRTTGWACWYVAVIPTVVRLRQEDGELETSRATEQVPGQPGLHTKTSSRKRKG